MRAQWDAFRDGAAARGVPEHDGGAGVREDPRASPRSASRRRTRPRSALLAYQSAWLRRYHPAAFLCALLNAQPMGFYPPASLVRDGQRRGVEVLPPDVTRSRGALPARATARCGSGSATCSGLGEEGAAAVVAERERARRASPTAATSPRGSTLKADALERLVAVRRLRRGWGRAGGCCWELGLAARAGRRARRPSPARARPRASARRRGCPSRATGSCSSPTTPTPACRSASTRSRTSGATSTTWSRAPTCRTLPERHAGSPSPGLAIARQRPASANGVVFLLLEDEHGLVNLILMPARSTSASGCWRAPSRCCSRPARSSGATATSTSRSSGSTRSRRPAGARSARTTATAAAAAGGRRGAGPAGRRAAGDALRAGPPAGVASAPSASSAAGRGSPTLTSR